MRRTHRIVPVRTSGASVQAGARSSPAPAGEPGPATHSACEITVQSVAQWRILALNRRSTGVIRRNAAAPLFRIDALSLVLTSLIVVAQGRAAGATLTQAALAGSVRDASGGVML